MPHGKYAQCPCCGKIALGEDNIENEFGYRDMGIGYGIIPQSYCRDCRRFGCEAASPCKVSEMEGNTKCRIK